MTIAALVCAALALWVSGGSLTVLPLQAGLPRAGILPSLFWLIVAVAAALALWWTLPSRWRKPLRVLLLSAVVLLPWLPIRVPAAFLVWAGPIRFWVWLLLAASIVIPALARGFPGPFRTAVADPRRAPWLAGAIAASAYIAGAWAVLPRLPSGDEPHYLIITQSLLQDHDLKVENNYVHGDYRAFYAGDLKPDYLRRGQDKEIYSIHAPGLPALVAPVFATLGYPGVLLFLSLLSAVGTGLAWTAVWRVTRDIGASWFGWAAVALSAPFFFQAFTMYPDAPGGVLLMVTIAALATRDEPSTPCLAACGATLALLPWLHTRFAVLSLTAGAMLALRVVTTTGGVRRLLALLALPAASALAWFSFFYVIYGTADPAAPYNGYTQTSLANLAHGIPGLLFDQQFGLLPNAPVYICAVLGFGVLLRRMPRLAAELLAVAVPYVLAVAAYQMWWAGYSSPARFLAPVLLPLAIPAGLWFAAQRRSVPARVLGAAAVALSLLITTSLATVERGSLLFNSRDGASRLLLWLSPVVNLTTGLPSLFQSSPVTAVAQAGVWLLMLALVAGVAGLSSREEPTVAGTVLVVGAAAAALATVALSVVWRSNGSSPITAVRANADLRSHVLAVTPGQIGVRYSPFRLLAAADVVLGATWEQWTRSTRAAAGTPPSTTTVTAGPIVSLPYPLAATYELSGFVARPGTGGRVAVSLDRQTGAAWSWTLPDRPGEWRQTFTLPTPARVLLVDADATARHVLNQLSLRAIHLPDPGGIASGRRPLHAVRYGSALVLVLSGLVYVEPAGAWLAGGATAELVIQPDPGTGVRLFLRNAPVENHVTLESPGWRQDLTLGPREERLLDVPVDRETGGASVKISCASGVRPSENEHSADTRLLGCWIETR